MKNCPRKWIEPENHEKKKKKEKEKELSIINILILEHYYFMCVSSFVCVYGVHAM